MATINMNVGGARRGTAPQFQIASPQGTAVTNLLKAFTNQPAAATPAIQAPAAQQQAVSQPSPTRSNTGNSRSANLNSMGSYSGTSNPMQTVKAMQALAMLGGDAEAAKMMGTVGTIGQIANANSPTQVAMAMAPTLANKLGVPGGVLGLGMAAYKQDAGLGIDAAMTLANPMLGAINAIYSAVTGESIGTDIKQFVRDTSWKGEVNDSPDPVGQLISNLTGAPMATPESESSTSSGGSYGFTGNGNGNLGSMGGGQGLSGNSNTTSSGGYGFGGGGNLGSMGGGQGIGGSW